MTLTNLFARLIFVAAVSFMLASCGSAPKSETKPAPPANVREKIQLSNANSSANSTNTNTGAEKQENKGVDCKSSKRDGLAIDSAQTFAIDFKPFEKSCFVTFHDPASVKPARGAQFFIYREGRSVSEFPDQFNGSNIACWVSGVSFEDLNDDKLTDIIVLGRCGESKDAYNENMVYLNNGTGFTTSVEGNLELMDFTKPAQVREFVKKNRPMFSF